MRKCVQRMLKSVLVLAILLFLLPGENTKAAGATGVYQGGDGNWYYYVNGAVDYSYTGLAGNDAGWWYIDRGAVDFSKTGLVQNEAGWWYVTGGQVRFDYTGLAGNEYGWWYINGGAVDFSVYGLVQNEVGWWYVTGGQVRFDYDGMVQNDAGWWCVMGGQVMFDYTGLAGGENGWWYVRNGMVDFSVNSVVPNDTGWWCVMGGQVMFDYTGLASNENGWWYIQNGAVNFGYTGMANNEAGWWYVINGGVDFGYTGLGTNEAGVWYYQNGTIDFNYTGTVTVDGTTYNVVGGKVDTGTNGGNTDDGTYQVGSMATGAIETGVYIIRSNSMPGYALTAVEDRTAQNGWNVVMSKVDGDNDQKFLVVNEGGGKYCFMSMKYYDVSGTSADQKWLINAYNGGWDQNAAGNADNIQLTSVNTGGAMDWALTETSSGVYSLKVVRGDDYAFYMSVPGGVSEGANVVAIEQNNSANQLFNFVSPYAQTIKDGTYSIGLSANNSYRLAINESSVKDDKELVTATSSGGTDQLFNIRCVDSGKGLYTIQNANSQRYLYTQGSVDIGASVSQISKTGLNDQNWYIQKNSDGTYSFVSANSNQNLTYTVTDGRAELNKGLFQAVGNDQVSQKFVLEERTVGGAVLETGVYTIGGKNYRISNLGSGVCTIYSLENSAFCSAGSGDKVVYTASDTGATAKWKVDTSGSNYVLSSVANGKYLTEKMGLSDSAQKLGITDITSSVTDYAVKYDLSTLGNLDGDAYKNVQVVKRMQTLGLTRNEMLNPQSSMIDLENTINSAMSNLPSEVVQYTGGNTVHELNKFMKQNMGKVVQLTADIEVYIEQTNDDNNEDGVVLIPSNTVLDGNGHKLVLRDGATAPSVGIEFYYIDDNNNWAQVVSENCGVKNLTTAIPYSASTLNAHGADKIMVTGCNFSNAGLNAVVIADRDNNDPTVNGWITNNVFSSTGEDAIGVYGNISNLLIANNRVNNSGEYGIMLSCLGEGDPIRVDAEIDGPHDIIARENDIENSQSCAMYCLGTYRVYITGNKLYSSQLEGICLDTGCIGTYFANNDVFNNGMTGGLPGVSIDNGIYNIIDGNNVHDNACNGIKLVRTGEGNIIVNNTCTSNSANIPQGSTNAGISIEAKETTAEISYLDGYGSDSNVVINNTIGGTHTHGIMISDNSATGWNANNVVKYNKISAEYPYGNVDFSTVFNDMGDNIIQ